MTSDMYLRIFFFFKFRIRFAYSPSGEVKVLLGLVSSFFVTYKVAS